MQRDVIELMSQINKNSNTDKPIFIQAYINFWNASRYQQSPPFGQTIMKRLKNFQKPG
jgi:hypothetical protein